MKVGDLVRNLNSEARCTGIVVDFEMRKATGGGYSVKMPVVLWADKRCSVIMPDLVEVINDVLSDQQLENVMGGMTPGRFSQWRAEQLNESR